MDRKPEPTNKILTLSSVSETLRGEQALMVRPPQFPTPEVKLVAATDPAKFEYEIETRLMQQYRVYGSPFWDGSRYCVLMIRNG